MKHAQSMPLACSRFSWRARIKKPSRPALEVRR